jgi:hypothetical protein
MSNTVENAHEIATTIKNQLGGKALYMIGAKNLLAHEDGSLSFKIGRNHRKINHVKITLNALDLYEITFSKVPSPAMFAKGHDSKVLASHEGLFWDQLKPVIERETGLYTSL